MATSAANGKNPLKRVCNLCGSTDKALTRTAKQPKDGAEETVAQKERREAAEAQLKKLRKLPGPERSAWYRSEKQRRQQEGSRTRRNFSSAVGTVTEASASSTVNDGLEKFVPFKDWAMREIILGNVTKETAQAEWSRITTTAGAVTKKLQGEVCLRVNALGEVRSRDEHRLEAAVKQRMDLSASEELDEFAGLRDARMQRAEQLLEADRLVEAQTGERARSALLTVKNDFAQALQLEEQRAKAWAEQLQAAKEEKESQKNAKVVVTSMALERLAFEHAVDKGKTALEDFLARHRRTMVTLKTEPAGPSFPVFRTGYYFHFVLRVPRTLICTQRFGPAQGTISDIQHRVCQRASRAY